MNIRGRLLPPQQQSLMRWDVQEIVRRRLFHVQTAADVAIVIDELRREKAVGRISLNLGPGGIAQTLEFEERSKVNSSADCTYRHKPLDNGI